MKLKPYPKYKPSGVDWLGVVPEDWKVMPLKWIVSTPITDGPHETPEIFDEGIPFISAEAVRNNKIDFERKRGYISEADHKRFSLKYHPKRNDIYMIKSGATTGNLAIVETDEEFNIWSPLAVIRTNKNKAFARFVLAAMNSKEFQTSVQLFWSYGTQQNIGMNVIENLSIPIPPLSEQHSIAGYLDRETGKIDELIAKKEQLIERLKEKRTALISRAVTKGLNPNVRLKSSGVEWLGDVPEHWGIDRLKWSVSESVNGIWGDEPDGENDVVCVRVADFDRNKFIVVSDPPTLRLINPSELKGRLLKEGDLLIEKSGGGEKQLVGCAVQYQSGGQAVCSNFITRLSVSKGCDPRFLIYLHAHLYSGRVTYPSIKQTTGIQNLDLYSYLCEKVCYPPLSEQISIAEYLDHETRMIDGLIEKVLQAIEKLKEYRTALISAAVTGKIDVRNGINA